MMLAPVEIPPELPSFQRCDWRLEDTGARCPLAAVCNIEFWVTASDGRYDVRRNRRSCERHIETWRRHYWPRLGREGTFRLRLTIDELNRRLDAAEAYGGHA